jgi:hypothetical protein
MRRPRPPRGCRAIEKKNLMKATLIYTLRQSVRNIIILWTLKLRRNFGFKLACTVRTNVFLTYRALHYVILLDLFLFSITFPKHLHFFFMSIFLIISSPNSISVRMDLPHDNALSPILLHELSVLLPGHVVSAKLMTFILISAKLWFFFHMPCSSANLSTKDYLLFT